MPHEVKISILFQLSLNLRGQTQLGVSRPVWTKPLAFNRPRLRGVEQRSGKGSIGKGGWAMLSALRMVWLVDVQDRKMMTIRGKTIINCSHHGISLYGFNEGLCRFHEMMIMMVMATTRTMI